MLSISIGEKKSTCKKSKLQVYQTIIQYYRKNTSETLKLWYGMEKNSGEKERPSCMSLNFATVWNKILVKKKDPPVCLRWWAESAPLVDIGFRALFIYPAKS